MVQDKDTGRAANAFGRENAERVAKYLGAEKLSKNSNEAIHNGKRIVIKSARQRTPEIGLSEATLSRINYVVASLENEEANYVLYKINPAWYRRHMVPSRSKSPSAHKIWMISCRLIREKLKKNIIGTM